MAAEFIAEAIERNGIAPHTVHADRGTSMTPGLVSERLTNLGMHPVAFTTASIERQPRTPSRNSATLKYLHDFPDFVCITG
ncbi:MAG: hypothetical protein U5O16_03485 [Rhodococcus sp. (in: high G+C Gram-positive bacteria)]|uniref:hypothetical protein n=1 Tax=Rhodococcus sp. TaxID=1831 RepID=UPI002ADA2CCD|nr:hypothetical protein [Rhodococcus sp. (in: high G+C Gram-positive bacteria)]